MAGNAINSSAEAAKGGSMQDLAPGFISRPSTAAGFTGRRSSSFVRYEFLDETDKHPCIPERRITINISGRRFDIPLSCLAKHPETLLGNPLKLHRFYDSSRDEYYFNRDRCCFESILSYYQSGLLRRPNNARLDAFVAEARFFELEKEAFVQFCHEEGFVREKPEPLPKNPVCRKVWQLLETPHSSPYAKLFAIFSMLVIVLSIFVFCAETLPQFREPQLLTALTVTNQTVVVESLGAGGYAQFEEPLFAIETACIAWFTLEFLLRLITCPDKMKFMKSQLNIIDFVAILPYYMDLFVVLVTLRSGGGAVGHAGILTALRILRLIRVLRIFKISRHSRGLQILGRTFIMSMRELGLLLLFLGMGVILYSSAVYYAEHGTENTQFTSIPEAFWWAIVTSKLSMRPKSSSIFWQCHFHFTRLIPCFELYRHFGESEMVTSKKILKLKLNKK